MFFVNFFFLLIFRVERVCGDMNVADALSRLVIESQPSESFDDVNDRHLLYQIDAGSMEISWDEIETYAENDNELTKVRSALLTGSWAPGLRRYESQEQELRTLGFMLFKGDRIILPVALRNRAIQSAHQGHVGIGSTKRILREYFWWPNMSTEAANFVKQCETCLRLSRKNPPIPLTSRELPNGPWEILQLDFYTDKEFGYGEFLVVVDTYSRHLHVVEMKNMDADSTNAALNKIFSVWGLPLAIQSDNGPPFQSENFIKTWENKGVKIWKSIPLHAQSNGAVERQNKGIKDALAAAKLDNVNWKIALERYVNIHNKVRPLSRLGVTPFELLVGWKFRGTFPCLWETSSEELDRQEIREKDADSKLQSKQYADLKRGAKKSDITIGDKVIITQSRRVKSDPTFGSERFTVVARQGAKIVVRSERGVTYSRSVQDAKKVPEIDITPSTDTTEEQEDQPLRPQRSRKTPSRFNDMHLYQIFE